MAIIQPPPGPVHVSISAGSNTLIFNEFLGSTPHKISLTDIVIGGHDFTLPQPVTLVGVAADALINYLATHGGVTSGGGPVGA